MIDPSQEELLSLADAARTLPARRGGKRPHVSCIYRWTTVGCRGVILESLQCGGTRVTSTDALARFFRLTELAGIWSQAQPIRTQQRANAPLPERSVMDRGVRWATASLKAIFGQRYRVCHEESFAVSDGGRLPGDGLLAATHIFRTAATCWALASTASQGGWGFGD